VGEYGNAASRLHKMDLADRPGPGGRTRTAQREVVSMIGHQYQAVRLPEKARACFAQAAAADPRGINRASSRVPAGEQHTD